MRSCNLILAEKEVKEKNDRMERKERENEGKTQDPAQLAQYLIE